MMNVDIVKKAEVKQIDWDVLFIQFVRQEDTTSATGWLKTLGWADTRVYSGNTKEHIAQWGIKRADIRNKIVEKQLTEARKLVADYLPTLVGDKLKVLNFYHEQLEEAITKKDLKQVSHIFTKIKTELGEPAIITKQNTEDVGDKKDPALSVLIAMGFINADGSLSTTRQAEAQTTDVKAPQDVA